MKAKDFFTAEQKQKIEAAIKEAELNTSGEIRVHIENRCKNDVLDCAAFWFEKLAMHKTELRNGVLFYLAIQDKKFAILGDAGINEKVGDAFWNEIKEAMKKSFQNNLFAEGLIDGVLAAGEQLKKHFPHQVDDINELDDEISFS